ncbi:alpha-L-glutamate ligase [Streptomyces griseocarneus]|nr:alpha-L-glutamate ligase [Streptomyces griseocarneus]
MTVLVLTRDHDATADLVINDLGERGIPVHRLDPGDFPGRLEISARIDAGERGWSGALRGQYRDLDLAGVASVYYRRPTRRHHLRPGLSSEDAQWAGAEARAGFVGVLESLSCLWMNHPACNVRASVAPVALAAAARCGLTIPRTLITSSPEEARAFVQELPGGVAAYKALGHCAPSDVDGRPQALWTTKVSAHEITDGVAATAHQFQEWIDKSFEVRLTVVGKRTFATAIHALSEASRIDFRSDYASLEYRPCIVPPAVEAGVHRLIRAFGLRYAALDFVVNRSHTWFLVDLNPNGQWAFVPELRPAITSAIADLLEAPTHGRSHSARRRTSPPDGRTAHGGRRRPE